MTSLPTQKGEREEALILARLRKEAAWQVDHYDGAPCSELLIAAADTIERLLSSSKAEGEMRERVEKLEAVLRTMVEEFEDATYDMNDGSQSPYRRGLCADARAALSPKKGD